MVLASIKILTGMGCLKLQQQVLIYVFHLLSAIALIRKVLRELRKLVLQISIFLFLCL